MGKESIYFFKPDDPRDGFLCQWSNSKFSDGEHLFYTAEQYMMYHKALTFSDTTTAATVLSTADPKKCKELGRQVANFDPKRWDQVKFAIVQRGSYLKFTSRGETLKRKLLETGDKELVEGSRSDRVWGVGFSVAVLKTGKVRRDEWGENLLGKALMTVRERIRDEEEKGKSTEAESWEDSLV